MSRGLHAASSSSQETIGHLDSGCELPRKLNDRDQEYKEKLQQTQEELQAALRGKNDCILKIICFVYAKGT